VVEYVFSGARFKIYIPKEKCFVFFALSGLRCPARSRKSRDGEPLAEEAYKFSRMNLSQRDVMIEIEDCNNSGTLLYLWRSLEAMCSLECWR
jgi:staphylococcal nuclease domain-containing protein 1